MTRFLHLRWPQNPMVRQLKQYRRSAISPVAVTAGIGDRTSPDMNRIQSIEGLPKFVKFELRIAEEGEDDLDLRFHKQRSDLYRVHSRDRLGPKEYCNLRRRTFGAAFPVSRERVLRAALLDRVRKLEGFDGVTETQVVQAAINLMLSSELMPGDRQYCRIADGLPEKLWRHIYSRYETANGGLSPGDQLADVVAHQLELDVRHVLAQVGIPTAGRKFVTLQLLFRRKGFVDD